MRTTKDANFSYNNKINRRIISKILTQCVLVRNKVKQRNTSLIISRVDLKVKPFVWCVNEVFKLQTMGSLFEGVFIMGQGKQCIGNANRTTTQS